MNRNLRDSFYLLWIIAIFLCTFAVTFAVLFVSCSRAPARESVEDIPPAAAAGTEGEDASPEMTEVTPPPTETPEPTPEPGPTILEETENMGQEYIDRCMFLGDSTTYGFGAYGVLPWTQIWTPASGTMTLSDQSYSQIDYYYDDGSVEQMLIRDAVAKKQPDILIVTMGVNGLSFMEEDEFKREYIDLVQTIQQASPDTKIILQSIYPVIDSDAPVGINNAGVNQANQWVLAVAEQTGVRYLNTHDAMLDENGELRYEYCNGDGVHLDTAGFEVVLNSIRTHGYR